MKMTVDAEGLLRERKRRHAWGKFRLWHRRWGYAFWQSVLAVIYNILIWGFGVRGPIGLAIILPAQWILLCIQWCATLRFRSFEIILDWEGFKKWEILDKSDINCPLIVYKIRRNKDGRVTVGLYPFHLARRRWATRGKLIIFKLLVATRIIK